MRQQLEGDVGARPRGQWCTAIANTHTQTNTAEGNAKWEGEGGPIALGENSAPEIHKNKNAEPRRGLSSSPPPTLHTAQQHNNTHTTAHTAPCTTHAVHRGRGGGGKAHARTASPHTYPTSVSLKNRRRGPAMYIQGWRGQGSSTSRYRGYGQGGTGGCVRRVPCHTHLTSHQPNTCRRPLPKSRTTSPRPGTTARAVGK
jgi:hypothetical protein